MVKVTTQNTIPERSGMAKRIYPSPVMTNEVKTFEQKLVAVHNKLNDLYYLFRNGSILETDFIKQKDKLTEQIIKLQKENKNEQI